MKITPSNQTLILAGERRGPSKPAAPSSAAKAAATGGSVLSRVTIVATQPDSSVVYLRADYSPATDDGVGGALSYGGRPASSTAIAAPARTSNAVVSAPRASTNSSGSSGSSYLNLKPTEQYAFTQRLFATASTGQYIDAYA